MRRASTGATFAAPAAPEGEQTNNLPTNTRQAAPAPSAGATPPEGRHARAMWVASVAAASLMSDLPVFAATPAGSTDDTTALNEVVVTANKLNSAGVLETPGAIQALSGQDLQKRGDAGFMDVAAAIPGLAVQDLGPGDRKYIIRGVSSTGESTTGVYYDEAVISGSNANDGGGFESDIRMYDLNRIEVLRGPQGTLYGAGSMSGTIRFVTNKPNLNELSGYLTGEVSNTEHGSGNYDANGAINLPIVADKAAVRVVGWWLDDSGFIDQVRLGNGTANPVGSAKGVNNDSVAGARVSLRVRPIDNLTLDASFTNQGEHSSGSSRYTPPGRTAYQIPGTPTVTGCELCNTDVTRSPFNDHLAIFGLTAEYKTPVGTVTGTTNQYNRRVDFSFDNTATLAVLGIPLPATALEPQDRKVNSSEIRFASALDSPINFVVGGFRQHETYDLDVNLLTTDNQGLPTGAFSPLNSADALLNPGVGSTLFGRTDKRKTTQYAAFGEATWTVTPKLKLTAGLRYFTEHLEGFQVTTHPFLGLPEGVAPIAPIDDEPQSYNKVTSKFNASYQFNDAVLVYGTASQGFRGGGLNVQSVVLEPVPPSFGPDSLWNYEIGFKGRLLDRRLDYQVDAYAIYWHNIQVQQTTADVGLNYTGNAGEAVSKGIEFEFNLRPIDYLTINFSGSVQDAYLKEGASAEQLAANTTLGRTGDKLPQVPPYQAALGVDWTAPLPVSGDWKWTLAADVNQRGAESAYFDANTYNIRLKSYTLLNLRARIANGPWSAMIFARNVTDERAQVSAINSMQDPFAFLTVRPRTVGLSITRNF
jgi:iron complex outermembrane receptor protein